MTKLITPTPEAEVVLVQDLGEDLDMQENVSSVQESTQQSPEVISSTDSSPKDKTALDASKEKTCIAHDQHHSLASSKLGVASKPSLEPDPKPPIAHSMAGCIGAAEATAEFRSPSYRKKGKKQNRGNPSTPVSSSKH